MSCTQTTQSSPCRATALEEQRRAREVPRTEPAPGDSAPSAAKPHITATPSYRDLFVSLSGLSHRVLPPGTTPQDHPCRSDLSVRHTGGLRRAEELRHSPQKRRESSQPAGTCCRAAARAARLQQEAEQRKQHLFFLPISSWGVLGSSCAWGCLS